MWKSHAAIHYHVDYCASCSNNMDAFYLFSISVFSIFQYFYCRPMHDASTYALFSSIHQITASDMHDSKCLLITAQMLQDKVLCHQPSGTIHQLLCELIRQTGQGSLPNPPPPLQLSPFGKVFSCLYAHDRKSVGVVGEVERGLGKSWKCKICYSWWCLWGLLGGPLQSI